MNATSSGVLDRPSRGPFRAWSDAVDPHQSVSSDRPAAKWAEDDLIGPARRFPVQLGKWAVTGILGRGGYGVVYEAEEVAGAHRRAALKILPKDAQGRPEAVARFFRESAAVARLDHAGIVKYYDFGKFGGRYFFTMELIDGRDLHRVVREEGVLPEQRAAHILAQVADALGAIASLGFVHRDLKPENVVLQPGDRAKLIDFGLVKIADTASITARGDILGTPFFMAPEYIQTGEPPDIRADVYGLGVIFHFLLTGRYPFEGKTPAEIFDKHLSDPAPAPSAKNPRVSDEGDRICRWLLEKSPANRPDSASAAIVLRSLARTW